MIIPQRSGDSLNVDMALLHELTQAESHVSIVRVCADVVLTKDALLVTCIRLKLSM